MNFAVFNTGLLYIAFFFIGALGIVYLVKNKKL